MNNLTRKFVKDVTRFGCESSLGRLIIRSTGENACDVLKNQVSDVMTWLTENSTNCENPKMETKAVSYKKKLGDVLKNINNKCERFLLD